MDKEKMQAMISYKAMNQMRRENYEKGVIVAKLFDAARESPLINSRITAWEAGHYHTFEQMLIELVLSLNDENGLIKSRIIKDLNSQGHRCIIE